MCQQNHGSHLSDVSFHKRTDLMYFMNQWKKFPKPKKNVNLLRLVNFRARNGARDEQRQC